MEILKVQISKFVGTANTQHVNKRFTSKETCVLTEQWKVCR